MTDASLLRCSTNVENLIAFSVMGIGLFVSFFFAGMFAGRVQQKHPAPESDQAYQVGCLATILGTGVLWLAVCFPIMRLVLRLSCNKPFGLD